MYIGCIRLPYDVGYVQSICMLVYIQYMIVWELHVIVSVTCCHLPVWEFVTHWQGLVSSWPSVSESAHAHPPHRSREQLGCQWAEVRGWSLVVWGVWMMAYQTYSKTHSGQLMVPPHTVEARLPVAGVILQTLLQWCCVVGQKPVFQLICCASLRCYDLLCQRISGLVIQDSAPISALNRVRCCCMCMSP